MTKGHGQGVLKRKNYWPQVSVDHGASLVLRQDTLNNGTQRYAKSCPWKFGMLTQNETNGVSATYSPGS